MAKSIITDNMEECMFCGAIKEEVHHMLYGNDHKQADLFGLLVPVCRKCHKEIHYKPNVGKDLYLKQLAQSKFEEVFPALNWIVL